MSITALQPTLPATRGSKRLALQGRPECKRGRDWSADRAQFLTTGETTMSWKMGEMVALGGAMLVGGAGGANGQSTVPRSRPFAMPTNSFVGPSFQYPNTGKARSKVPKSTKPNRKAPVQRYPSTTKRPTATSPAAARPVMFAVVRYEHMIDSSGREHVSGPYT